MSHHGPWKNASGQPIPGSESFLSTDKGPRVPGGTAPKPKPKEPTAVVPAAKTPAPDTHQVFTRGYTSSDPTDEDVTALRGFLEHVRNDGSSQYSEAHRQVKLATTQVMNEEAAARATFINARTHVRRLLKAKHLSLSKPSVAAPPKSVQTSGEMRAPSVHGREPATRRLSISSASETAASDVPTVMRRVTARPTTVSGSDHDIKDAQTTSKAYPEGILKRTYDTAPPTKVTLSKDNTPATQSMQGIFSGICGRPPQAINTESHSGEGEGGDQEEEENSDEEVTAMSAPVTKVLQFVLPVRIKEPPASHLKPATAQSDSGNGEGGDQDEEENSDEEEESNVELAATLADNQHSPPLVSASPASVPEHQDSESDDNLSIEGNILDEVDASSLCTLVDRFLHELNHDLTPKVSMDNQSATGKGRRNKRATAFISLARHLVRHILDVTSAATMASTETLLGAAVCSNLRLSNGAPSKKAFKLFLENTVPGFHLREGLIPIIGEPGPKTSDEVDIAWARFLTLGKPVVEEVLACSTATYPLGGSPNAKELKESFERVATNITNDATSTLLGLQGMFVLTAMQHDGSPFEGQCTRTFATSGARDFVLYRSGQPGGSIFRLRILVTGIIRLNTFQSIGTILHSLVKNFATYYQKVRTLNRDIYPPCYLYRSGLTLPLLKDAFETHVRATADGAHSARTLLQLGYEPPPRLYGPATPFHTFRVDPTAFMTSEADILRRIAALGVVPGSSQQPANTLLAVHGTGDIDTSCDVDFNAPPLRVSVDDDELALTAPITHQFLVPNEFVRPGESQEAAAKRVMRVTFPIDVTGQTVHTIWIPLPDGHTVPPPLDYTKVTAFSKREIKSWLNQKLKENNLKEIKGNQLSVMSALDQFWAKDRTILWWGPEYPMPRDTLPQLQNGKGLIDSCHTAEVAVMVSQIRQDFNPAVAAEQDTNFQGKAATHIKILSGPINWPNDGTRMYCQYNGSCCAQLDSGIMLGIDFSSVRKADILKDVPKTAEDLDKKDKDAKDAKETRRTASTDGKPAKKRISVVDVDKELDAAAAASALSSGSRAHSTPTEIEQIWSSENFKPVQKAKKRPQKTTSNVQMITLAEAKIRAEQNHAECRRMARSGYDTSAYVEVDEDNNENQNKDETSDDDAPLVPARARALPPPVSIQPPPSVALSPGSVGSPPPVSVHNVKAKMCASTPVHASSPPLADDDESGSKLSFYAPPLPLPKTRPSPDGGTARTPVHVSSPPLADDDESGSELSFYAPPLPSPKTRPSADGGATHTSSVLQISSPPVAFEDDEEMRTQLDTAASPLTALEELSPPPPSPPLQPAKKCVSVSNDPTSAPQQTASTAKVSRTTSPPIVFDTSDTNDDDAFQCNKTKLKAKKASDKASTSNKASAPTANRKRNRKEIGNAVPPEDKQPAKKQCIQRSASPTKVRQALNRVGLTQSAEQAVNRGVFTVKTNRGDIQIPRALADSLGMSQEQVSSAITTAMKHAYPKDGSSAKPLEEKSKTYKSLRPLIEQWDPVMIPLGLLAEIVGLVMPDVLYTAAI
ncbi:hypothetical protein BKA62DRAFT_679902 [Auriculariales sp. MPI-PUGE-AT-0066]|nr:hypothetical protein BKA62DRAFT_679902 [Auriculariales sp. MPI-PUGE-AT-0066]